MHGMGLIQERESWAKDKKRNPRHPFPDAGEGARAWSSIYPSPHPAVTTTTRAPTRTTMARGLDDMAARLKQGRRLVKLSLVAFYLRSEVVAVVCAPGQKKKQ